MKTVTRPEWPDFDETYEIVMRRVHSRVRKNLGRKRAGHIVRAAVSLLKPARSSDGRFITDTVRARLSRALGILKGR